MGILLVIFDLTTTVWYSVRSMERGAEDTIKRTESQISEYILSVWNLGNAIAAAPATRDSSLSLRQRAQMLVPYADAFDLFMIGITNEKGLLGSTLERRQITSTAMLNDEGVGDLSSRQAFQDAMATGDSILTDTYPAGADGKTLIYTIWIPYYEDGSRAGVVTVSIKFAFISDIIQSTSLKDNFYFTLVDSRHKISANPDTSLIGADLSAAYAKSRWVSVPLSELERDLSARRSGSYWGINNARLEYIRYMPIQGTPWSLIMRTDFFGSFQSAFLSLAVKLAVYLSLFLLLSLKRNRDIFARDRLFTMMTANIDEVFLAYDLDRRKLTYVSGNAERMLGLSADRLMADADSLRPYIRELPWDAEQAATDGDYVWVGDIRNPRTGRTRPFHFRAYQMAEDGRRWAVVVLTDLTEEQKQKKLLEDALTAAEKANAAKSTFLTNMSHDIRTPMNAIVGMTAIASAHIADRDRVLDCLSKITVANTHLLGLINDVLDMSTIETGKMTFNHTPFCLSALCRDLVAMIQPQVEGKGLALFLDADPIVHERVVGDTLRLNQAFINIVGNAVKFTAPSGSLRIRIQETASGRPGYGLYRFTFTDTGIGIDPAFLPRLFQPFERAENSTVSTTEGSGLGLAITRQIVHLMQGDIDVESEPGRGSRFTVTVPLRLHEEEDDEGPPSDWVGCRVLVVDDDEASREATIGLLRMLDMEGVGVGTGAAALDAVRAANGDGRGFHAVLADRKMPGMDGMELTRRLRDMWGPELLIVMVSAYDWSEMEETAREAGVNAFLVKPLFRSDLHNLFRRLAGKSGAERTGPAPDQGLPSFSSRRVLLVEDNALNREIALAMLDMAGVTADTAGNGREALDMFVASPVGHYHMVIMDIQMPVMNGYEATAAIRELDREDARGIPIIAMTADAFVEDVRRAQSVGMNGHVTKPVAVDKLMAMLRKWL